MIYRLITNYPAFVSVPVCLLLAEISCHRAHNLTAIFTKLYPQAGTVGADNELISRSKINKVVGVRFQQIAVIMDVGFHHTLRYLERRYAEKTFRKSHMGFRLLRRR